MPYLKGAGVDLYYEDVGEGPPILTTHGLLENGTYWSLAGVTARLALTHRVISLDLRGHGRTTATDGDEGFAIEVLVDDIDRLADSLDLDSFHLLTHATGGMVGARYAMTRSDRLESLVLSDTTSATLVGPREGFESLAAILDGRDWPELHPLLQEQLAAFFEGFRFHADPGLMWAYIHWCFELGSPSTVARFVRSFFDDPDPHVEGLRAITCPTLVIVGELDRPLQRASELLATEIPDATLLVLKGVGHMTALEDPNGLLRSLRTVLPDVACILDDSS